MVEPVSDGTWQRWNGQWVQLGSPLTPAQGPGRAPERRLPRAHPTPRSQAPHSNPRSSPEHL